MQDLASLPAVTIAGTEQRHLSSAIVGQDYLIKVRLPSNYATSTDYYPVLYLLDGDHAFAMATDIVQYLEYGCAVPDLIIVSPAYGSKETAPHGGTNMRDRDFAPFQTEFTDTAPGGEQYFRFLKEELIPFAETTYRINPADRSLWGFSFSSLFGLYAIFQSPGLFQRSILLDGFHKQLFEIEAEYALSHTSLPLKLYVAWGGGSGFAGDTVTFAQKLESRGYEGLEIQCDELNNLGHMALGAEGLTKGLVSVFRH